MPTTNSTTATKIPAANFEATDPVVMLGRLLGELMRLEDEIDAGSIAANLLKDSVRALRLDKARAHQFDRVLQIQDSLAAYRATTLEGAAIHIGLALNVLEILKDNLPEEAVTHEVKQRFRALDRLLYSSLGVVDAVADTKIADNIDEDFYSTYRDPWRSVEASADRLATTALDEALDEAEEALRESSATAAPARPVVGVTYEDVRSSYDLIALLKVAEHAARTIEDATDGGPVQLGLDIAVSIKAAIAKWEDLHDLIEENAPKKGGAA